MHARVTDMTAGMGPADSRVLWAQPFPWTLVVRASEPVTADRLPAGWATAVAHRPWTPPGPGRHRAVMVVNPCRQRTEYRPDGSRRNVRYFIDDRDEQVAWLHSLLDPMIGRLRVDVQDERMRYGWHRDRHRVQIRLLTVALSGEIRAPGQLSEIVTRGFGRARAYGGGLSVWEKS